MAVTLASAAVFVLVELAILIGYLQRRRSQPWSGVPGKSHEGFELTWALGPAVFLAALIALTLQLSDPSTRSRPPDNSAGVVTAQGER
jgi:hypothetical protein